MTNENPTGEQARRHIETYRAEWNGVSLEISWELNWLGIRDHLGERMAHLQVRSVSPGNAALPVTSTGYRSHFTPPGPVLARGGPVPFVLAWLDEAARSPEWRDREAAARQRALF
jgi:hypothetical protein